MSASNPPDRSEDASPEMDLLEHTPPDLRRTGPLAWMAQNSVAANLLMLVLVIGGILMLPRLKQEVFPEFELDFVLINVPYPGASPAEVEQGVILAVEEAVRGVDGVKEVTSTASEGAGVVVIELMFGTDADRALADVKSAVDRVTSFPQEIERPVVSLVANRREVISLVLSGDKDEKSIRHLAEQARDALLDEPGITVVELAGVRPPEISVEVPRAELRRFDLTLEGVAAAIRQASVELPGGGVKTPGGEILVRTTERRARGSEFADIVVASNPDGTEVHLRDIAKVTDGFRETDQSAYFNGQRAAMVRVFRVGDQTPIGISDTVRAFAEDYQKKLPEGVQLSIWADWSEFYKDRLDLLLRNAMWGLALVILVLSLFLEVRLAFWVTLGIPISFIGSLLFLPMVDASINMISLFAFIVTLGMVVDDAIVVGEAVYKRRTEGLAPLDAAIAGVREVAVPVMFAIFTTIIAFSPLLFVPGMAGKFFRLIPIVVIAVLCISLVESLVVLPAHLAHSKQTEAGIWGMIHRRQQQVSRGIEWLIHKTYEPFLMLCVRHRYLTLTTCLAILIASIGLVAGGRVKRTFMPKVEGDIVVANLTLPFGAPVADTRDIVDQLVQTAEEELAARGGSDAYSLGTFAQVGAAQNFEGAAAPGSVTGGGHVGQVQVFLVPMDQRPFSTGEFVNAWRQRIGEIPGIESLKFKFDSGPSGGNPIQVELRHRDLPTLEAAAARVATAIEAFAGVHDLDDGFAPGKEQLDLKLKPAARALGVTETDLARQLRAAFYGAEAVRDQRGRDELRVLVRLPEAERESEHTLESLMIRPPTGGEIPLGQAAEITRGRAYTQIKRRDGRRIVNVSADVDTAVTNAEEVLAELRKNVMPDIVADVPGLSYGFEGEQRMQREVNESLGSGFSMALIAMFALLAVAFRSYVQPIIVMSVIPFGFIGAVAGHAMLGYSLSLMSMMGLVALSGVVVNDSLILIVAINRFREDGMRVIDAIHAGGVRRFRPIILTSLTTFLGLTPMILETSFQARFLIPMAISLGFGVLFATFITLLMVPALYGVLVDAGSLISRTRAFLFGEAPPKTPVLNDG